MYFWNSNLNQFAVQLPADAAGNIASYVIQRLCSGAGDPGSKATVQCSATPVLLGFENTLEKEFFEKLLTVPKMGPKGALSLLTQPVSVIAGAV